MPVVKEGHFTADDKRWDENHQIGNVLYVVKFLKVDYILNYHNLLEHSKYKRPPIGIS